MTQLTRRGFLAVGGSVLSALALPGAAHAARKPRRPRVTTDWNPAALWVGTDPWGAH